MQYVSILRIFIKMDAMQSSRLGPNIPCLGGGGGGGPFVEWGQGIELGPGMEEGPRMEEGPLVEWGH